MSEKRMFTKKIVDSDAFLEMPLTSQALYFHLNMQADDDGFVNNPRKIQRIIGASEDDLKLLLLKRFVIGFETGVVVIKHWRMHNLLRKDRYNPTQYIDEFNSLMLNKNGSYTEKQAENKCGNQMATKWQPNGNQMATQYSIGKDSIDINKDIYIGVLDNSNTAESSADATADGEDKAEVPVLYLPLIGNLQFPIFAKDIEDWQPAYPAIDVLQELYRMRSWFDANPKNKKTELGIKRFIVNWLGRSQDRSPRTQPSANQSPPNNQTKENKTAQMLHASYDMMQEWAESMEGNGQ